MPKIFDSQTIVIVSGTTQAPSTGEPNILFEDSFALADTLAGELGPVQTQDSVDLADVLDAGPVTLADSVAWADEFGDITGLTLGDSVALDETLVSVDLDPFTDSFDVAADPDIGPLTLLDSVDTDDAATLDLLAAQAVDSLALGETEVFLDVDPLDDSMAVADAFGEVTLQDVPDSVAIADAFGEIQNLDVADSLATDDAGFVDLLDATAPDSLAIADSWGPVDRLDPADSLAVDDAIAGSTLSLTEFAAATHTTTGVTNPGNVLGDTTATFAEVSAAASGIGGITSNNTAFTLEISMSDLDIDNVLTSYTNVDVHFEWSFLADGTDTTANGGHDMDWERSLNDGGAWVTLAANNHTTHGTLGVGDDAKQTTSFDLTGVLDTETEFNQLRLRATGICISGTGLNRISRLRFHRMWVTATVEQI